MRLFFLLLTLAHFSICQAQFRVSYRSAYYITQDGTHESIVPGVSQHILQDFYIGDGYYKSIIAGGENLVEMYRKDNNERAVIYVNEDIETVEAIESNSDVRIIKITSIDSTTQVLGYQCKAIRVEYEGHTVVYYFSDQVRINPDSFSQHTYRNYNQIITAMDGGVPLKFSVEQPGYYAVSTAFALDKISNEELMETPKNVLKSHLKESEKAYTVIRERVEKRRKEWTKIKSFEASGNALMNQFKLPMEFKYKEPAHLLFTLSINDTKFFYGSNDKVQWEYNPIEDNGSFKNVNKKEDDNFLKAFNPVLSLDWKAYKPLYIKDLDSVYFVYLIRDSMVKQYFIDKETLLISKWGNESSSYDLGEYTFEQNTPFPMHITEWKFDSKDPEFEVRFEKVKYNVVLNDSLFEIPQALKSKIKPEEAEKPAAMTAKDYYESAEKFLKNKQYDSAILNYKEAIKLNGSNKVYHNQIGLCYLNIKDYYQAIAYLTKALDLDPAYSIARENLGYAKMSLGDYKNALTDFSMAIEIDSTGLTSTNYRGLCYFKLKEYALAKADFQRAIEIDPEFAMGYWNTAMAQYNLKEFEQAIPNYSKYLESEKNGEVYNYRGICYYRLQKFEEAAADFKNAIESDKPLINYYGNLGDTYLKLNNPKLALQIFEKGVAYDSAYDSGFNNIGLIYLREDSYDAAIESFTRAIMINAKEAVYFDNRAMAKSGKMDYAGAVEDYSESISLDPKDPNIYYLRGMAKINMSDKFDGCKDLRKSSELGHATAKESLEEYCSNEKK